MLRTILCLCVLFLTSACTHEVSSPSLSSAEIDKEIKYQETTAEKWIVDNETSLQEKLKAGVKLVPLVKRKRHDRVGRVADVWYRITTANAPICANHTRPTIGIFTVMKNKKNANTPWAKQLKLSRTQPTIRIVANNSPAQKMGLRRGDRIIAINDQPVRGRNFLDTLLPEEEADISFIRNEKFVTLTIKPERACKYGISLRSQQVLNAFADGRNVVIYGKMVDFLRDENELALIMSHELAHNIMRHMEKGVINSTIGYELGQIIRIGIGLENVPGGRILTDLGIYLGDRFDSQGFETEADYVGMYLAARAQYDVTNVGKVWRRMSQNIPEGIDSEWGTHPNNAKRYLSIQKTAKEIEQKVAHKEPILPNLWTKTANKPQDVAPKLGLEVFD